MTKGGFAILVGVALVLAIGLRVVDLDRRPMHHDEANQAVKFGVLVETGDYRYDRTDHHGPTLYYLTLPVAWARGQTTLASLDAWTVRIVPALFGVGLLLLFLSLASRLGRTAVAVAMTLAALSPALVYYSRFYIQESIFAFLAIACLMALGRYAERPRLAGALSAGVCAGLAYATKETSVMVVPAAMIAVTVARRWTARDGTAAAFATRTAAGTARTSHLAAGIAAALAVAYVFLSSFFSHPDGLLDSIRAFGVFVDRGTGASAYSQPWDYYLRLLGWSSSGGMVWTEAAVLALALVGMCSALRPAGGFWPRAIAIYTAITAIVFSAVSYKTPWNLLPFYAGIVLLAGIGAQALLARGPGVGPVTGAGRAFRLRTRFGGLAAALAEAVRPAGFARAEAPAYHRPQLRIPFSSLVGRRALTLSFVPVVLLAVFAHLGWQSWRAIDQYAADPRNPYVYAHTSPDFLRLVQRVTDLAVIDADHERMLIRVAAGPYEQWPLPWYLRRMERVGYWPRAADAGPFEDTPVIVASQENAGAIETALGDRYISEMYGLRPEVFLTVFVERSLWERYLATRR